MTKSQYRTDSRVIRKLTRPESAQIEQSLSELVDGVAHELNNNVAVALGHVQLLKLKNKDDNITEGLNRIEKSMFKCGEVIKAIRSYAGRPNLKTETTIAISESLMAALELDETSWKETGSQKNLTIVSIIEEGSRTINSDGGDLITALSHLIHNAVEASPKNGTIEIKVREEGDLALLSIADKGDGISDNLKLKIYEPFFTTKKSKISGLGLTIVQSIVARWGGRIGFSDNHPSGTIFTVSFPLAIDRTADGKNAKKKAAEKRILIVDDDEEVRNVLGDMLAIEGVRAENCSNAYSALQLLEKGAFNMVITDLGMPGMSGYDLAEYVREKYKDVEIVLLTGWGNSLKKDGKEVKGVRAIISKPFRLNDVLELVRN